MLTLDACWFEGESSRGDLLAAGRSELLARHVFVTWVAGVRHHLEAAQDEAFAPGSPLLLRPEPDNPVDPDAVGVWDAAGRLQVGYVPRVVGESLPPWTGQRVAMATTEEIEDGRRVGLGIFTRSEWYRRRFDPTGQGIDVHGISRADLEAEGQAAYSLEWSIVLPKEGEVRRERVVHELAHILTREPLPNEAPHGPRFTRVHLLLVHHLMGPRHARLLWKAYRSHGVEVSTVRVHTEWDWWDRLDPRGGPPRIT